MPKPKQAAIKRAAAECRQRRDKLRKSSGGVLDAAILLRECFILAETNRLLIGLLFSQVRAEFDDIESKNLGFVAGSVIFLLNNREILIVEDNPADVRLMREALRFLEPPVSISVTSDGEEALHFLRREGKYAQAPRPGLIFLDFNLPKYDSKDLLQQIKADPDLRLIPIAVLTTSNAERDVRDAYQRFANCYLNKAADLDGFFRVIQSAAHFWLDVASMASDEAID